MAAILSRIQCVNTGEDISLWVSHRDEQHNM